ncbi:unnamed protein product [Brachionus calyciflorus]|uniref:RING-type domain-containing protein n=1 Tax=Brachionus calyciflorus TaxID=104777 RepID=A0A813VHX6_9BILA|nr:unnamed protein product [Brachionus calyciflorus]
MEFLKTIFECKICNDILKAAFKLPCDHSICKAHITKSTIFTCKLCRSRHLTDDLKPHTALNNLFGTIGRIEASFRRFDLIKERPYEFIDLYIEELRNKIDLKREEIKLEVEQKSDKILQDLAYLEKDSSHFVTFNLKKDMDNLLANLAEFTNDEKHWKIGSASYFAQPLIKKLSNLVNEEVEFKKDELITTIDESCIELIDDLEEYKKLCNDKLDFTKSFVDLMDDKISTIKDTIEVLFEQMDDINDYTINHANRLLIKVLTNLNKDMISLRNEILLNRGFEFEKKQFNYPELDYFKEKNKGTLHMIVKNVSSYEFSKSKVILGEKSPINYIPFGIGVKFYKSNRGIPLIGVGLIFENKYEFSGIVASCTVHLINQVDKSERFSKSFIQNCKRINHYFKKIVLFRELIGSDYYDSKNDSFELIVNVELEDLKLRSINDLV